MTLDLLLINPGGRERIYQGLGPALTAIEPPLWCRLIAGYVRDRGFSVEIIDAEAIGIGPAAVAQTVAARAPRLVCMVAFGHQPSASTQQMDAASVTCCEIKALSPRQTIVIVGGHVSALPERTLAETVVDFTVNGEGPETVAELLRHLKGDHLWALSEVPGLVWRHMDGAVYSNKPAALIDVKELHGDAWDLLPMRAYRAHNWQCFGDLSARQPYAAIYTSLGCPFKCSFCCINAPFHGNRYRMRDPEAVVAEIDMLHRNYGVSTFKIIDEMFVLNDRHVTAICEGLAAKPYAADLNIWAYARVDTVKAGQLPLLRRAGIRWLALGIESASAYVRDGADKALKTEDIVGTVRAIQAADINVIGNFIFGLPDDTTESMRETLALALELKCEFANFYSAMPYPGSRLFAETPPSDLPQSWAGYSQHSFDTTPLPTATLTAADVLRFRDDAFHAYFADPGYLESVERKFGAETRAHVEAMASKRLPRKLLAA